MSHIFATGLNGYLLSEYIASQPSGHLNIAPITEHTLIPPQSTVLLAGWPTRLHYDSPDHISFLNDSFKPLLRQISKSHGTRIILFGTCLEYGKSHFHCHEYSAITPTSNLGIAKAIASDYAHKLQIPTMHLRIFYPYNYDSPRRGSILWHLSEHLKTNPDKPFKCSHGLQLRDFFHTSLLNHLLSKIILSPWTSLHSIVNVCSGRPRTVRDLLYRYLSFHNLQASFAFGSYPLPSYEPLNFYGSASRLSSLVGVSSLF